MNRRSYDGDESDDSRSLNTKKLYKNPDRAKLCGVCAGLSEYFGFETWLVRLITVSFFLFSVGSVFVAYFVACFILDPKPGSVSNRGCFGHERKRRSASNSSDSEQRQYNASVKDVWKKGAAPSETLQKLETSFHTMESKLQKLESYVTSNKYQLDKEFQNIS
ncbi:MAG: envelope stress response membrane protein PspC [Kangiellaceae bacterium]|nr:envelope stress response membrane protein PspC [Kangiellaceae bacterium]